MKKVILLSSIVALSFAANAQYTLTGASPYVQNFDGIGTGLPSGWSVYSGASATGTGTLESFSSSTSYGIFYDTSCAASAVLGGGFKNYPSASSVNAGTSCTAQQTVLNRAIGVRQVSPTNATHPNLDSGASFNFTVANTGGITNLGCSFRLQSLDTASPRVTTWRIYYKIGTSGTWTEVTPTGTMTTGGNLFTDNPISASFGTALNNQSSPVYFRICTIDFSSGTGNRASTAIDSFKLTWTGSAGVNDVVAGNKLPMSVVNASTNSVELNFDAAEAGAYAVTLTDMVGRTVSSTSVEAAHGNQNVTLNGLSVVPGMYIAKVATGQSEGITKVLVK